jgi:transposase
MVRASVKGESNTSVAKAHNTSAHTVIKWTRRFVQEGTAGLHDQPRSGRPKRAQSSVTLTNDQTETPKQITRRAKVDRQ